MDQDYLVDILQTMCGMSDEQLLAEFKRAENEPEIKGVGRGDPEGYMHLMEKLQGEVEKC